MKKLQRNWSEISSELSYCLATCKLTYAQLAEVTGLSYHAARRYLLTCVVKNNNHNARLLIRYFGVATEKTANIKLDPYDSILQAVSDIWDGTDEHAQLLVKLITATQGYKFDAGV